MLPILVGLLSTLAENGLGVLVGAIKAKGKEFVENKIGVKIPDDASKLTPDLMVALKKAEMLHEEALVNAVLETKKLEAGMETTATEEVTKRWQADMSSDSWLSKNIRPMTLLYILSVYTIFALLSAAGILVTPAYVELLGQWGMLIMSAYFIGRTVEKGLSIKKA